MVIDDGLVNRLAHMRARIDRDRVDTQRAAGPSATLHRAEPSTEHNLPPERTESAAASERYAALHFTETAISGQAPSVARPRTCQYPPSATAPGTCQVRTE